MSDFISFTSTPAPPPITQLSDPGEATEFKKECQNGFTLDPEFKFKVALYQCDMMVVNSAGVSVSVIGQGPTLKEAHQEAYKNLNNILNTEEQLASNPNKTNQRSKSGQLFEFFNGDDDSVNKLLLVSKHMQNVAAPVYEEISAEGPGHMEMETFTISCLYDGIIEHGTGNDKESAKQDAASKILGLIYQKVEDDKIMKTEFQPNLDLFMKSKNNDNDLKIEVKGNSCEAQTQTDPESGKTEKKELCEVQTQTKSKGIDQIGKIYDTDSDTDSDGDCDNSNLKLSRNDMNNLSFKTECELGELVSDEEEEENQEEKNGFDFDSLFNDQPSSSVFSEVPKYSRTGIVHQEKSLIFEDMLTKMRDEDRINDNIIKRHRPFMDNDDGAKKKPKMLNFVSGNVSHPHPHNNKPEMKLNSTRNNEETEDDDIDQMINMDKINYGVGSKLMLKMGFTPGTGLGKNQQGIKVPIKPQSEFKNYKIKPGQRGWVP